MDQSLNLGTVLQLLVAVATMAAALATRKQAKISEKTLLLGLRPLVSAEWSISTVSLDHVTLVATIREITGVFAELRKAHARVWFVDSQPDQTRTKDYSNAVLHKNELLETFAVPIDLRKVSHRIGPIAFVDLTLTVSAAGVDDPRIWRMDCHLNGADPGKPFRFTVTAMPVTAGALHDKKQRFRKHLADRWRRWEAWNDRFRGPIT